MPVKIDFRGVMLFNCDNAGGNLTNILIPDAQAVDEKWQKGGKHPDDSEARVHYAGLVVQRPRPLEIVHVPLRGAGATVRISIEGGTGPTEVELDGLPMLRPATFGIGMPDPNLAAATVTITGGGKVKQEPKLPDIIESDKFLQSSVTHHGGRLEADKITITVKIGLESTELKLRDNDRAAIYNYEVRYPTIDDLELVGQCLDEDKDKRVQDDDFKWLYSLLSDWDKDKDIYLLAPKIKCQRFVTVFTCFPAVWEESPRPGA